MGIAIIRGDQRVYKDGAAEVVPLATELPDFIRAVQWNPVTGKGHIEFEVDSRGIQMGNLPISDITPFKFLVDGFEDVKAARLKAIEDDLKARVAKAEAGKASG